MSPLDMQRLRARSAGGCVAHGRGHCPVGGGQWSRGTWEAVSGAVEYLDGHALTFEAWTTAEASRCRPATAADQKMLASIDVQAERAATREAADQARQWLAEHDGGPDAEEAARCRPGHPATFPELDELVTEMERRQSDASRQERDT
jgi:hypothetical protein